MFMLTQEKQDTFRGKLMEIEMQEQLKESY